MITLATNMDKGADVVYGRLDAVMCDYNLDEINNMAARYNTGAEDELTYLAVAYNNLEGDVKFDDKIRAEVKKYVNFILDVYLTEAREEGDGVLYINLLHNLQCANYVLDNKLI